MYRLFLYAFGSFHMGFSTFSGHFRCQEADASLRRPSPPGGQVADVALAINPFPFNALNTVLSESGESTVYFS
jgi:hypothetical protein